MASLLPLPRNHLLLLRHLVLSLLLLRASVASSRDAELDALMELKAALDPPGRALASWARGGDPCGGRGDYFEGVACDGRGRVATVALQGKGLTGTVPPALAMLPGLTGLYLHYNRLSGEVPRQLGQLPGLAELYLGVNNLSGRIPVELGRLRALQVLQLGYNQLSGSIPTQLGQLRNLTVLALQSNQLTGAIPASLGDLPALARLDLSSNHLFGSIPSRLAQVPPLVALDLRNNTLSGSVPSGLTKLRDGFRYENNSELCGAGFGSLQPCPAADDENNGDAESEMPRKPESTSVKPRRQTPQATNLLDRGCGDDDGRRCSTKPPSSTTLSTGAVLAGTVIIVAGAAACGVSAFSWHRRQKQRVGSSVAHLEEGGGGRSPKEPRPKSASSLTTLECSSGWDDTPSQHGAGRLRRLSPEEGGAPSVLRFNLEEVECATQHFSDANLLGRRGKKGSNFAATHRGVMRDGAVVAVRSIARSSCKLEEADFLRGLRVVTSLRHENLVGLRGFCRSRARGECFLVYELVEKGSLSRYLDVNEQDGDAGAPPILDWPARVSIIKGIARGIDYLHSSKPPVLHQSISADKVLLDGLFAPRLAGAGLHKLLADDVVFSGLKDSAAMGYLAPEYAATGRFTDKGDVYAFGVVVFQVLAGSRAVSRLRRLGAESGRLEDLVDPRLEGRFSRPEAARLAGVALLCTSDAPAQRPAMAAVLQQLGAGQ